MPPNTNAGYGPSKAAVHWLTLRIDADEEKNESFVVTPGWAQTDFGNAGAQYFGLKEAETPVEDSCSRMFKPIGEVTKASNDDSFGKLMKISCLFR
ncbi:hypothetical protein BJ878DRAFT_205525 [Calycina marina]|uniref:Uncharacterized protein n=1 Tax=Calycina marina TaxID=1763456 RepID=A0A9P7Z9B9_9HELO|nr:hypothetical protein BJ878DRAFT_205525 [Calycina marina]